jgi:putative DNA primase/helicase
MTATKTRRSAADLLGDPQEPSPLDKIEAAVRILGKHSGGDTANGHEFYQRYGDVTVYVPELKQWLAFSDGVWSETDAETLMQAFCADLVRDAAEEYRNATSRSMEDAKRALARAGQLFDDRRVQERALKSARAHMSISSARFNRTPHLLGVRNGVLNLKTMKLIQAPAREYISKRMGCAYDPTPKRQCGIDLSGRFYQIGRNASSFSARLVRRCSA